MKEKKYAEKKKNLSDIAVFISVPKKILTELLKIFRLILYYYQFKNNLVIVFNLKLVKTIIKDDPG